MLSNIKKKINGPIFSIILPFLKNGNIEYISLKKYINFLYKRGAKVFYLMVYNSRFSLLDEKEIIRLNLFCIKVIKKLNKNNLVICAEPYHCSTRKSVFFTNLFHKKGADIVSLIFGEKYYSSSQVYKHFKYIHENTKVYLLLHQQVLENGIDAKKPFCFYSIELLNKICSLRKFVAMKEDSKSDKLTKSICKKLKKIGEKIYYEPNLRVWHYRRSSFLLHIKQVANYGFLRGRLCSEKLNLKNDLKYYVPSVWLIILNVLFFYSIKFNFLYLKLFLLFYFSVIFITLCFGYSKKNIFLNFLSLIYFFFSHFFYGINFLRSFIFR